MLSFYSSAASIDPVHAELGGSPLRIHAVVLSCLALVLGFSPCVRAEPAPPPRAPAGSVVVAADAPDVRVVAGQAWLTQNAGDRQGFHLHGPATVRFPLSGLKLAAGRYRLGLIARTGTRWIDANGQIGNYRWTLIPHSGEPSEAARFEAMTQDGFRPLRVSGEPDSWANWYGTIQVPEVLELRGDEQVEIANLENHGGILALWLQPVHALNAARVRLSVAAPHHAFVHGDEPAVRLRIEQPAGMPPLDARLVIEWFDLVADETVITRSALKLPPGQVHERTLTPGFKPGVHRVRARLEAADDGAVAAVENVGAAQVFFACAPARPAAELPDDWPLGAHVSSEIPPLPGFRWYRYFAQWPEIHIAPGRYDWGKFDAVFAAVRAAGGRLMVASDGSPVWTSSRGKAGMAWSPPATAYPPDDWTHLRDYLDAMLARYVDERGTLAALELCNEANTRERWLGDTADMLAMARVFREAVAASGRRIPVVGLAISAGDQRRFVNAQVEAGLLDQVDAVSAHFYEELMSPEADTPINNLPRHVAMLRDPMRAAGRDLPMINTETGIAFAPRVDGRPPTQEELNAAARDDPGFDHRQPWLVGTNWRRVGERRAAATYVAGIVQLMALDVGRSYVFSQLELMIDGAPSLPWVALGRLGDALHGVDYSHIRPLPARYPDSDEADGSPVALAYLIGEPGRRQVIVAMGFLRDTSVGRSKHWQPWLEPRPLRIETAAPAGTFGDLYGRETFPRRNTGGAFVVPCGEEPVFIAIP